MPVVQFSEGGKVMALPSPVRSITPRPSIRISNNQLTFCPELAAKIGVEGAIFLSQLEYWIQRSGKERDGKMWVYNTLNDWLEQFPFWKKSALHRVITDLETKGMIISTSAFNVSKIDRTKWYAINYDHEVFAPVEEATRQSEKPPVRPISHIREMHHRFPGNASSISGKSDTPIPETTTETTTEGEEPQAETGHNDVPTSSADKPFDLVAAMCEAQGQTASVIPARERGKQCKVAERMIADGYTATDVFTIVRWLKATWSPDGIDMFLVEKQAGKWRLAGQPSGRQANPDKPERVPFFWEKL